MAYAIDAREWYKQNRRLIGFAGSSPSFGDVGVYTDWNYGGKGASLAPGRYNLSDLTARGIPNDSISSLKIPAGYKVTLYADANFTGASTVLTSDAVNLDYIKWNDKVSSLVIEGQDLAAAHVQAQAASQAQAAQAQAAADARNALRGRWDLAKGKAGDAASAYQVAVAHANRAIHAANAHGVPSAVAAANQASSLVPQVLDRANTAARLANDFGHSQGFAGFGFGFGDAADDAAAAAAAAQSLVAQVQALADQAEAADAAWTAAQAPSGGGTAPAPAGGPSQAVLPVQPSQAPVQVSPSISISVPGSTVTGAPIEAEPPISKVLLYGGAAVLALLLLKK